METTRLKYVIVIVTITRLKLNFYNSIPIHFLHHPVSQVRSFSWGGTNLDLMQMHNLSHCYRNVKITQMKILNFKTFFSSPQSIFCILPRVPPSRVRAVSFLWGQRLEQNISRNALLHFLWFSKRTSKSI